MTQQLLRYGKAATFCTLLICIIATKVSSQIITTVAGNGTAGYNGDSIPAINAELYYPNGITIDKSGNLFISDYYNSRIRKVSVNGIISTVAGNGIKGYSGDGGTATSAELSYPFGIAVDTSGNLFISDYVNSRIRKVSPNGIISTVAGNGTKGYSGDGGTATSAELGIPINIAFDRFGNLYIADSYNNVIRKVTSNGIISTVAGNSKYGNSIDGMNADSTCLGSPYGLLFDSLGNMLLISYECKIFKIDTNGIINTVAGNGTFGYSGDGGIATLAELNGPTCITIDASGNLYIAEYYNSRIRKVTGIVTPVTLSSFTTTKHNNNVVLNWQTATEINTAYFNIQRSTNGKDFATVGSVNAKGAGSYNYCNPLTTDDSRFTKLYYRLQVVDKDGSKTYSEIRSVLLTIQDSRLTIAPNPAKDIVYIAAKGMMHISVMDNTGKIAFHKSLDNLDNTSINIANLSKGVYYVSVKDNTGKVQSGKMVVE